MNRAAADQRRARRLPRAALWNKRSPSEGSAAGLTCGRTAALSTRNRALATSVSPASSAVIAASTNSSSSASIGRLATLLHVRDSPHLAALSPPRPPPRKPPIPRPKPLSYALLHSPAISPDPCSTPGASTKPNDLAEAVGQRTRVERPGPRGEAASSESVVENDPDVVSAHDVARRELDLDPKPKSEPPEDRKTGFWSDPEESVALLICSGRPALLRGELPCPEPRDPDVERMVGQREMRAPRPSR